MSNTIPGILALALFLAIGFASPVLAQAPSAEERQQELLRIWYEIREGAASKGEVEAKYDVGVANYLGRGTAQDRAKAVHWFQRAADRNHASAHHYLGYMYAVGVGVEANPQKSLEHYRLAAELGNQDAQYSVGQAYEYGRGVRPDLRAAVRWYRAAAEQGEPQAQTRLGDLYLVGRGVDRDAEEAYLWYGLARNEERMAEARQRLTRSQIAAADERVRALSAAR
ncbi:tetratricopeptide repeat protein [Thioalkalivibrio nitratireducens]|nr:tetratricopeptide repeat protein [Thioalkalivibrio nitratireducens]